MTRSERAGGQAKRMVALLAVLAAGAMAGQAAGQGKSAAGLLASKGSPAAACQALSGLAIPAASLGLPTTGAQVTGAALVAADASGNANGEYCLIKGAIHPVDRSAPDIQFELNIPTRWNNRILQLGGGGYNGRVITGLGQISFAPMPTTPLSRGYATYGSDSGHQSASGATDASFALNAEALANYGYASLKKTHDAAVFILRAYFGPRVAYKSYFAGASSGGRESLTAIERWPADYDGAYVGAPTANFWGLRMIGLPIGKEAYGAAGYLNPAKQALVFKASAAACDTLDGLKDNIISDVAACQAKAPATMAALRCPGGRDTGDSCLSDAQLKVLETLHTGLTLDYAMAHNSTRYPGYNVFEGADFDTPALGLGSSGALVSPPTTAANGYLFAQATEWLRYFVTQNPTFDPMTFDPLKPGPYRKRLVDLSQIVGAADPDLSAFKAHGGKVIMMQGLTDTAVSPNATIALYDSMVQKMGKSSLDQVMRFYTIPGFAHGNGVFVPSWDVLAALDAWVTSGRAPGTLIGTDTARGTAGRTRPLCVYPAWPRYNGSGDPNSASSFTCSTS
jgi:feruloyl esterase